MFPPFINSFGDQFFAVMLNAVGTIMAGVLNTFFSSIITTVITPLLKNLAAAGHTMHVLSRHAGTNMPPGVKVSAWDPVKGTPPEESLRDADAIIHLAGEPVAQGWTSEVKRKIRESRVTGTRNLVQGLAALGRKPEVLVCASAVASSYCSCSIRHRANRACKKPLSGSAAKAWRSSGAARS